MIINGHPSLSLAPRGPTRSDPFAHDAIYELKIDTNGDCVAVIGFGCGFPLCRRPKRRLCCAPGSGCERARRRRRPAHRSGAGLLASAPRMAEGADHRLLVGWRSDPFFLDVLGSLNRLKFTGSDFFADKDMCSLVLEIPERSLWDQGRRPSGPNRRRRQRSLGASRPRRAGRADAVSRRRRDRGLQRGRAGRRRPVRPGVRAFAGACRGYAAVDAARVAATLLPDILPFDHACRRYTRRMAARRRATSKTTSLPSAEREGPHGRRWSARGPARGVSVLGRPTGRPSPEERKRPVADAGSGSGYRKLKDSAAGRIIRTLWRPPCASMIDRQIDKPRPKPPAFVVSKGSKGCQGLAWPARAGVLHDNGRVDRSLSEDGLEQVDEPSLTALMNSIALTIRSMATCCNSNRSPSTIKNPVHRIKPSRYVDTRCLAPGELDDFFNGAVQLYRIPSSRLLWRGRGRAL